MVFNLQCNKVRLGGLLKWLLIGVSFSYASYKLGKYIVQVDGGFSEWSTFTACSQSCGGGTSTSIRSCVNPIPKFGGKDCAELGLALKTAKCNLHPCPVDGKYGAWGNFGQCSITCGGGKQSRERKCDNPVPQHGGKDCAAEGQNKETKSCNENPCAVNGGFTEWGSWTSCSATCGNGRRKRVRTCTNPAPAHGGKSCQDQKLGLSDDTSVCNQGPCLVVTASISAA